MLSKYILLFTVCSIVGWVYESIYAVIKTGKWEARGFLYGPMCPIYGFGVCGIVLLAKAYLVAAHASYFWWQIALVAFFGSMILEYVTSWALEKLFHAYWWDYADMPLNINGRTCVPAGILFCVGGLAAVYVISPAWDSAMAGVPVLAMDIVADVVIIIMSMDITLTISALTEVQERVAIASQTFHSRADEVTSNIIDKSSDVAENLTSRVEAGKDRLQDGKDRLQEEVLDRVFDSLNDVARMTLGRVEGFRLNTPSAPDIPAFTKKLLDRAKTWRKR